ncbi:hypothetical protein [Streptomyces swartbergensis]|uniref:hypothetical protein n=1 Tax=Streptomyces swartbergensis TaxID=487165 RepID=UPI001FC934DE|nr:hypothetical protein [Streptomyces swartbergensis]
MSAGTAVTIGDDDIGLAAVRVVGADVLLPSVLYRSPPSPVDVAVFEKAVLAYPPGPGASATSRWSHWAMTSILRDLGASIAVCSADAAEPDDAMWLNHLPWQSLTHQLALLAPLAVPTADSSVAWVAGARAVDVARGFVRAVRRRDWLQAAEAGRWLAVHDDVPDTLGLDAGLEFVAHMGCDDPRVTLHLHAARLLRAGAVL